MYSATRASVGPALSMLQMVNARSISSCRLTRLAASSANDIVFTPSSDVAPSYIPPSQGSEERVMLFNRPGRLSMMENTDAFGYASSHRGSFAKQYLFIESLYHAAFDQD